MNIDFGTAGFDTAGVARDLAAIAIVQRDMPVALEAASLAPLEHHLKELLDKAMDMARRSGASEVAVQLGLPFGTSIALSWDVRHHQQAPETSSYMMRG